MDTIFSVIDDCLIRMDLSLQNCRGQCYDGAGSMMGIRTSLSTQIQNKVTDAHKTHCHGHATSPAKNVIFCCHSFIFKYVNITLSLNFA